MVACLHHGDCPHVRSTWQLDPDWPQPEQRTFSPHVILYFGRHWTQTLSYISILKIFKLRTIKTFLVLFQSFYQTVSFFASQLKVQFGSRNLQSRQWGGLKACCWMLSVLIMFGAIEWKSVNKSIDLPVQKWSHCIECVGWAEYGQSGTRFYQPQTQNDGWAMKHHLTRARHKWMTDVGQIADLWTRWSETFSVVLQMSPVTRMSHGTVCKNEIVQSRYRYTPGTTYTGEMEEGVKLQKVETASYVIAQTAQVF